MGSMLVIVRLPSMFPETLLQRNAHCGVRPSPFVTSEEGKATAQLVWEELAQKLERIQPGILQEPFA
jgi:hypothetical protein